MIGTITVAVHGHAADSFQHLNPWILGKDLSVVLAYDLLTVGVQVGKA